MARPTISVKVRFDKTSLTWTEIGDYVRSIEITAGRNKFLDAHQASTMVIELDNSDRRFDPTNTAGPYVSGGVSQVAPMAQVLVTATHDGVDYYLGIGFADAWNATWQQPSDSTVTLTTTDAFKILARQSMSSSFAGAPPAPGPKAGSGINALIPSPSTLIASATGSVSSIQQATVVAVAASGQNVLGQMQAFAQTDRGDLFMRPTVVAGAVRDTLTWRPYWYRQTATSSATFSDSPGAGELLYSSVAPLRVDEDEFANTVTVTRSGGTAQTAESAAGLAAMADYVVERSVSTLHDSDVAAMSHAAGLAYRFGDYGLEAKFSRLVLDPDGLDDDDLWEQVCTRYIGDRITVQQNPPGGGSEISLDCFIEGFTHSISAVQDGGRWLTSWALSGAGWAKSTSWWRIGDATYGKIGTAALGA